MTTYVLATDHVDTSAALCDYLFPRLDGEDAVHAVNSRVGGDETTSEAVRDGEDALNVVASRLGAFAAVETRQFVRGNDPAEDVLAHAADVDADELVVGLRRHPGADAVFGETTRRILRTTDRPVRAVPLGREN